eukprot:391975-Pyramimonas_sp.AAC.1
MIAHDSQTFVRTQAALKYVRTNIEAGVPREAVAAAAQGALTRLFASVPSLDFSEAGPIIEAINNSDLDGEMKTGLIDLVNSKVGGSLSGGGRRTDNQVNYYVQRQLTTDDWNKLMDKNVSVQLKILTVVNRMESIGCVFPSEHTMTHIVGLITLASSPPGARDIGVLLQNAWQMLQDVKLAFRRTRTRVRLPHHGAIAEYPSNVDSMSTSHVDMYKRAYSSEGPAPCRVDETLLCELRHGGRHPSPATFANQQMTPLRLLSRSTFLFLFFSAGEGWRP